MDLDNIYLDIENLTDEQLSNLNNLYNEFKRYIEDYIHKRGSSTKLVINKNGTKNIIDSHFWRKEVSYTEFYNAIVNFLKGTQPNLSKDINVIEGIPDLRIVLIMGLRDETIKLLKTLSKRIYKENLDYESFENDCKNAKSITFTSNNLHFNSTDLKTTHTLYQAIAELIDFLYKRDKIIFTELDDYLYVPKNVIACLKSKEVKNYYKLKLKLSNLTTNNKEDEKQRTSTNEQLQTSSELESEQNLSNAVGKTTKVINKASESRLGVGNRLNGGSSRKLSKGTIQGGNRILTSESLNS